MFTLMCLTWPLVHLKGVLCGRNCLRLAFITIRLGRFSRKNSAN